MVYKSDKSPTKSPNKGLGLSPLVTEEFHFVVPPEAPVYTPQNSEFHDPLAYIAKIRPEAEKYGICKIKPPPDWQPPFAVDVDRFKFTPRIQRLNELEAKTRIKLNFLDQIAKFWELQGSSLKIPMVERRALDLYALHRFVEEEGGFYGATTNRKWSKIANRMGFPTGRDLGSVLKHHYERILHPFDIFKQGKTISQIKSEKEDNSDCDASVSDSKKKEKDYKPHGIVSRQAIRPPVEKYARRSKRCFQNKSKPGEISEVKPKCKKKEVKKVFNYEFDPLAKYICHNCERGDAEENMLLCDGCDDSYHTFCLLPPLTEIPKGDWRCPKCVAAEVSKPMEAFGFEQARREYTLQQFGEMADQFKSDYFNMPVHMVPSTLIEKEFWRIVSSIDEDVTVEYGADLHTMDHGSGFPTKISVEEMATCEIEYAKSRWNLNNLPCLENSVLGHINADISGMKIPWMYVGMCFATFCWHNEDHWSYSINYLHWGEAKTWYGVPGEKAEDFEDAMKKAAPELFQTQPDLLHQLVTIMNPNILMDSGVPVYRTDQEAGEFVITFPRAYHAGFNQGYNFAEAVNFAPADWLAKGRECIDHYSMLRRYCVFSHDELVCKMASCPNSLDLTVATATFQDMTVMVQTEKKLRKSLLEWGVTEAEREAFELLPDDERQCEVCKTTCFLSAVTCSCSNEQLVCLRHCTELCKCPPEKHTLRYRYTLDELPVMLEKLKLRVECYDTWCENVANALDKTKEKTLTLVELKALLNTAFDKKFPNTDLLNNLKTAVEEAEKCANVAQQLANKKLRTRTRQTSESKYKLTMEELTLFYEEIENLRCILKETDTIKELLEKVKDFQNEAKKLLDLETADSVALEKCIDTGIMLDVELPELVVLKHNLQRITWLEEVADTKEDEDEVTLDVLRGLLDAGVELPPHPLVEKEMACLQQLLMNVEKWEEKAKDCLSSKQRQPISSLEKLLKEGEELPAFLPSEGNLRDALKKAKDWIAKVEAIENAPDFPYLDTLENLVNKGRHIPVKLEVLSVFESKLENAKSWKERTARTFLRKNSRYTLMEALSPRTEFGINVLKMKKKKPNEDTTYSAPVVFDVKLEGTVSPVAVVAAFKHAERQEMTAMRDLRLKNLRKRASDKGDIKYCICRRGATGFMLQCELCKDWFHAACVPLPKHAGAKTKQSPAQQLAAAATREVKFLCPCCLRSRRPRLETILSLLVSLQKLEVRLPEGEALQCLTERAMNWQDRARTSLATDEIANALAKLSVLSQKLVEAAAREKTEKIITSELKKAAGKIGNPELHRRVRAISGVSSNEDSQQSQSTPSGSGWLSQSHDDHSQNGFNQDQSQESFSDKNNDDTISSLTYFSGNSEHAYSTASKTPLVKTKQPPLVLSEIARAELEELMLEGDLLEVSLDETVHIWRILQATKPKPDKEKYPPIEQLESELMASKMEKDRVKAKQRARKRRMEEHEGVQQNLKGKKYKVKQPPFNSSTIYNDLSKVNVAAVAGHTGKKFGKKHLKEMGKKLKTGKQMKRKSNEGEKKTITKRKKKVERESSTDSDSDENCAAKKCLKPIGKEVDWVQCDGGCEKWYHFKCLGIDKKDIHEEEDFICDGCQKMSLKRAPRHHSQPQHGSGISSHQETGANNRVKVEPTNLDESLGLDALLSLASGLPEADSGGMGSLESNTSGWMHQQGFSYDMDVHRTFHNMPPRSGLNISAPISNPPEMLLTPNALPVPPPAPIPNPPQNYPIQDRPPMQNYPPIDQHGYQEMKFQDKKLPPDSHYGHYGLPENVMQYSPHGTQNYNPQHSMFHQNYQNPQPAPPPPPIPPSYPINYSSPPNFQQNQNYPTQPDREYVQQNPTYGPHQNYRYSNPSYLKPDAPPYPVYPNIPQQNDGYARGNMQQPPPPPVQESYVLTQLTESSKSNYPVQSFPISESSFNQPDYHQMFPEENKTFAPKVAEVAPTSETDMVKEKKSENLNNQRSESSFNQPDYHQMFPEENKTFAPKVGEVAPTSEMHMGKDDKLENVNNQRSESDSSQVTEERKTEDQTTASNFADKNQ